jgi:hypothetical protein
MNKVQARSLLELIADLYFVISQEDEAPIVEEPSEEYDEPVS